MIGAEAMIQLVKNAVADLITRAKGLDDIHDDLVTVDTVVDAVKAKTDNLPSDPADASDVAAAITAAEGNIRGADSDTLKSLSDQLDGVGNPMLEWIWSAGIESAYRVIAGTWGFIMNSGYHEGAYFHNSAAVAINDEFRVSAPSTSTASRTLHVRGQTSGNNGITTIYVNGASQGTIDWYSAAGGPNTEKTLAITPVVGVNSIALKVASKHASSTDYNVVISAIWLT